MNMFFGILLLVYGGLLLLSELSGWDFAAISSRYWPILVICYGIVRLFQKKKSRGFSCFLIVFGILIQLVLLNILHGNVGVILFSLLMIFIGLSSLLGANRHTFMQRPSTEHESDVYINENESVSSKKRKAFYEDRDVLEDSFLFTEEQRIYRSDTFSGGEISVVFSTVELDLRSVLTLESEVHIRASVLFGTLTIAIPEDWHAIVNGKHYYSAGQMNGEVPTRTNLIIDSDTFAGTLRII